MSISIQAERISKVYKVVGDHIAAATLGGTIWNSIREISQALKGKKEDKFFWALKDISFRINEGEAVGIVGPNGAGKSSLLKIIAQITQPSAGRMEIYGRVASLLEVGTGFHLDLTGKENIYMNGTLLGMRKREVDRYLEEIIEFSGVGSFINTPIKKYSTGMRLRLAFAVAAHLNADIVLIDEILAVGDQAFQNKCLGKMSEIARQGRTILYVSHNLASLRNLCSRSLYLDGGRIIAEGPTKEIVQFYLQENSSTENKIDEQEINRSLSYLIQPEIPIFRFQWISITDGEFTPRTEFFSDEEIKVNIRIQITKALPSLRIVLSLVDQDDRAILTSEAGDASGGSFQTDEGVCTFTCSIPANLLGNNRYYLTIQVINYECEHVLLNKISSFQVKYKNLHNLEYSHYAQAYFRPQLNWLCQNDNVHEVIRAQA